MNKVVKFFIQGGYIVNMNEKEKQIISDVSYEGLSELNTQEIGQIIKDSVGIPESYKLENVLFVAIVKGFALGYFRGKTNRQQIM